MPVPGLKCPCCLGVDGRRRAIKVAGRLRKVAKKIHLVGWVRYRTVQRGGRPFWTMVAEVRCDCGWTWWTANQEAVRRTLMSRSGKILLPHAQKPKPKRTTGDRMNRGTDW